MPLQMMDIFVEEELCVNFHIASCDIVGVPKKISRITFEPSQNGFLII